MDCQYKDRSPFETIRLAKDFLLQNEIMVTESWILNDTGLYTVILSVNGTSFKVNGKGTTEVYTLASAYGELMERLQNLAYFQQRTNFLYHDLRDIYGYCLRPLEDYYALTDALVRAMPDDSECFINTDGLVKLSQLRCSSDLMRCRIFYEYGGDAELILPLDLIHYYYATNGMVAGNSKAEAFVQGISEILERYAIKAYLANTITPPQMDSHILQGLKNYGEIERWKSNIESTGRYKIYLLDLSLGLGLPVTGLILINIENASYYIKAGCHPSLEIAVERCFTELMQGKRLEDYYGMTPFSASNQNFANPENVNGYFIDGKGAFPSAFFKSVPSYEPSLNYYIFKDNFEMQTYLLNQINKLGFQIYCSDCTFSDIYAYQFIIPGMSEVVSMEDKTMQSFVSMYEISDWLINDIAHLNKLQAHEILVYIENNNIAGENTLEFLVRTFSLKHPNVYSELSIDVFKFKLYCLVNKYEEAYKCLKNYAYELGKNFRKNMFFDCYMSFLSLKLEGIDYGEISLILRRFYHEKIIEIVMSDFEKYPLSAFDNIRCDYNCDSCDLMNRCLMKEAKRIFDIMVGKMQHTGQSHRAESIEV